MNDISNLRVNMRNGVNHAKITISNSGADKWWNAGVNIGKRSRETTKTETADKVNPI
jgi:hypothetical protein